MTHTPAPWDVHIDRHGFVTLSAGPAYLTDTTQGFNIAGFLSPADAHLMRAAPKLLAALMHFAYPGPYEGQPTQQEMIDIARAAIAEANGE